MKNNTNLGIKRQIIKGFIHIILMPNEIAFIKRILSLQKHDYFIIFKYNTLILHEDTLNHLLNEITFYSIKHKSKIADKLHSFLLKEANIPLDSQFNAIDNFLNIG